MSILVDERTKVIVQGITGREGLFHTERMKSYGTNIVAGVSPKKGGTKVQDIPVFATVDEAVKETSADASCIFVSPSFAMDAILEALDANLRLIVCITEGIPIHDMLLVKKALKEKDSILIGPNSPGIISPGKCKIGVMPESVFIRGKIGVISRSGTLSYEAVNQLRSLGLGQSTCVGIGGDPILGTGFLEILTLFYEDPETEAVLIIGEIGGELELEVADFVKRNGMKKPTFAYIAGISAPRETRMGHAGAIISRRGEDAETKIRILEDSGIYVSRRIDRIGHLIKSVLEGNLCDIM